MASGRRRMATTLPLLLSMALAAVMVGLDPSDALQLHELPTFPSGSSSAASHKLIITLRDRFVSSRADDGEEQSQLTRTQLMTTPSGQKYACKIPLRARPPSAADPQQQEEEQQHAPADDLVPEDPPLPSEEGASPASKSPVELLDQLSALCLYRQEGLWTYEVCYKKHTRQFRQAMHRIIGGTQAETITAEDFSCGKFAPTQDYSIRSDFSATGIPMTYISHNLTDGAPCIMTGASRTSEVRFTCMPHAKDNLLVLVKEFPTCNYIYVVATPFLCAHPQFQPPPQRTSTVSCVLEGGPAAAAAAGAAGGVPARIVSSFSAVSASPPPVALAGGAAGAEPAEGQCQEGEGEGEGAGSCSAAGGAGEEAAAEQSSSSEPEPETEPEEEEEEAGVSQEEEAAAEQSSSSEPEPETEPEEDAGHSQEEESTES